MIRIVIFVVFFAVAFYLINLLVSAIWSNKCENCDGDGYWKGTRGERNHCKVCDGSGKK